MSETAIRLELVKVLVQSGCLPDQMARRVDELRGLVGWEGAQEVYEMVSGAEYTSLAAAESDRRAALVAASRLAHGSGVCCEPELTTEQQVSAMIEAADRERLQSLADAAGG